MPKEQPLRGHFLFFMSEDIEIWKDIPNYEGLYMASSLGNVKSIKQGKEKILKQYLNKSGYKSVSIYKNYISKHKLIHQLIAIAFLGHKPDGTHKVVVDHINNIKTDNRAVNLQLISQRENSSKDRIRKNNLKTWLNYNKNKTKIIARININGKSVHIGVFNLNQETEAHNAVKEALTLHKSGVDVISKYKKLNKTSKFKNIYYIQNKNKWSSCFLFKNRNISLGYYDSENEAKNAQDKAMKEFILGLDLNIIYPKKIRTSKYKHVSYHKINNTWRANVSINNGKVHLGYFLTEELAHKSVVDFLKKFGN